VPGVDGDRAAAGRSGNTVAAAAVPHYRFARRAGQVALRHAEVRDIGETWRLLFAPRSWHA
jgi:hypothetical protein